MFVLKNEVPGVIEEKIHEYFLDICLLQHKTDFNPCLKTIVFTNPRRMEEVTEEMSDAASTGDHRTLEKYIRFGHTCYTNHHNSEYTPLDLAILFGQHECVKVMLEYTSSIERIEVFGDGPVALAINYRRMSILRILLEKGFNPWGTNHAPAIKMIEWRSMYDAVDIYLECGIQLPASYLLKNGCTNILAYLMEKGFDPTEELYVRDKSNCDLWGTRQNLYKLIYASCVSLDLYNWSMLSRLMDHDDMDHGGGLLKFNPRETRLLALLARNREENYERFSFLWLQE